MVNTLRMADRVKVAVLYIFAIFGILAASLSDLFESSNGLVLPVEAIKWRTLSR